MDFAIEQRARDYWCSVDGGEPWFVGRRVAFQGRVGLSNVFAGSPLRDLTYKATNYVPDVGIWAQIIAPTIGCEGGSFLAVNSYDRAAFSFGIGQFAAHVPNGDFVRWMRALVARPDAAMHLPGLTFAAGRVARMMPQGTPQPLETNESTQALMAFLNPHPDAVDEEEVMMAARLMHWAASSRSARMAQIHQMIASFRASLMRADARGLIDGKTAACCCVIADLLHHGRGGTGIWGRVAEALAATDALSALLEIGASHWEARVKTLGAAIRAEPLLTTRRWSSARKAFG
jgi:hypothetical protein